MILLLFFIYCSLFSDPSLKLLIECEYPDPITWGNQDCFKVISQRSFFLPNSNVRKYSNTCNNLYCFLQVDNLKYQKEVLFYCLLNLSI